MGQVGLHGHLPHGELLHAAARAGHNSSLQGPVDTPADTSPGGHLLQAVCMDQLVAAGGDHKGRSDDILKADEAFHTVLQGIHFASFVCCVVFSLKYG